MWNKQSPARLIVCTGRLLSAGLFTVGGLPLLMLTEGGRMAAAVVYPLLLVGLLCASAAVWKNDLWAVGGGLVRRSGVVKREERILRRGALTAVEVVRTPFTAIFGAVRLSGCAAGDNEKSVKKASLLIKQEDCANIAAKLMPLERGYKRTYKAAASRIAALAFTQSDFFSGLLLGVPLISWLAKNIDSTLPDRIYTALQGAGRELLPDISPVLSAAALVPIVGWVLHFIYNFISYSRFRMTRSGDTVLMGRGAVSRRSLCFRLSEVSAVEDRQTVASVLLGVRGVSVLLPGHGRCVIIPAEKEREARIETAVLFPHGERGMNIPSAGDARWWQWWLTAAALSAVITVRLSSDAGAWRNAVLLLGLPLAGVLLWRAFVGLLAGKQAGVRLYSDCVEIVGVKGLSVRKMRVLRGNVAVARIVQNPIQRASGLCSMYICPKGVRRGLWCRHLPIARCLALAARLG